MCMCERDKICHPLFCWLLEVLQLCCALYVRLTYMSLCYVSLVLARVASAVVAAAGACCDRLCVMWMSRGGRQHKEKW